VGKRTGPALHPFLRLLTHSPAEFCDPFEEKAAKEAKQPKAYRSGNRAYFKRRNRFTSVALQT
jgi:hypothetical protein